MGYRFFKKLKSSLFVKFAVIALWLIIWQLLGDILLRTRTNSIIIATPYQVALAFLSFAQGNSGLPDAQKNILLTVYELIVAFGIASGTGLFIGTLIGQFKIIEESLEPLIVALLAVPNFVLFPIMFLLFSIGPRSDIAFGAYLGFFPVVANTIAGYRQVDTQLITLAKSLGASRLEIFTKIVFPSSVGPIVSGLKQGFSLCTIGVVGGEILAPVSGIGFLLTESAGFFFTPQLYALIFLTVFIAMAGNLFLSFIERKFSFL
jgi:ABC-type nitrate/sulfonate/bicarbonate transport system permease component